MTPNLFLATQRVFSPHKWFRSQKGERPKRQRDHWDDPVPGIYEYIPGRGWYLIAKDKDPHDDSRPSSSGHHSAGTSNGSDTRERESIPMTPPVQVKYSKVLKRYLLAPDYEMRKRQGRIQGSDAKAETVGFFRLDDGIAWVQCWDEDGEFIPGPYKLWCIDHRTGNFRHMLRGDDPAYISSRNNSIEGDFLPSSRRRSQESRSTQFKSRPGSTRDGPSVPSTRPSSIKGSNLTPSQPGSRSGSVVGSRRNDSSRSTQIQLEEAKERLRAMAKAQNDRSRSRANSLEDRPIRGRATPLPSPIASPAIMPNTPSETKPAGSG